MAVSLSSAHLFGKNVDEKVYMAHKSLCIDYSWVVSLVDAICLAHILMVLDVLVACTDKPAGEPRKQQKESQ